MKRQAYQELLEQNRQYIERLKAETDKLVIFGAGNTSKLYQKMFLKRKDWQSRAFLITIQTR